MASLHKQTGDRPGYRIAYRDTTKRSRVIWLGNVSKRSADTMFRHISELISASEAGSRPDPSTEKWARQLSGRIRDRLVDLGLTDPANEKLGTDSGRTKKGSGPIVFGPAFAVRDVHDINSLGLRE